MKHRIIIAMQAVFLILVFSVLYLLYPRVNVEVDKDWVKFNSINAKVIMISENPDFSNPRYIEIEKGRNLSFNLKPGTYYWKPDNGIVSGLKNEFKIEPEVGMKLEKEENETNLVNVGNVKLNVTKNKEGVMVGHIILEPEQAEKIEDSGVYIGREDGK